MVSNIDNAKTLVAYLCLAILFFVCKFIHYEAQKIKANHVSKDQSSSADMERGR